MPTRFPRILSLPQSGTEAALVARAAEPGIEIERGVAVTGLHQSEAGVEVAMRSDHGKETRRPTG